VRVLLFTLFILGCSCAEASSQALQDDSVERRIETLVGAKAEEVRILLDALKANIARNDRTGVCRLVHYPLRTSTGAVKNVRDCVKAYPTFSTPASLRMSRNSDSRNCS
jgi:hypothetical protein